MLCPSPFKYNNPEERKHLKLNVLFHIYPIPVTCMDNKTCQYKPFNKKVSYKRFK